MTRSETEAVVEPAIRPVMTPELNAEVRQFGSHSRMTVLTPSISTFFSLQLGSLMSTALSTAADPEASGEVRD